MTNPSSRIARSLAVPGDSMLRRVALAGALVLAALAPAMTPGTALARDRDATPDFEYSWRLAPGKTIEIKGVNGAIEAEPTSGDEVQVTAVKHAKRSDPASVRIEVNRSEDGITVCAVYPGAGNGCEPGESWHSHTRDNDVVVDFTVKVPRGVRFAGKTVNGGIVAEDLRGPIAANTVNGSISLSTSETAEAATVNGSVVAKVGRANWDDALKFNTVNGAITVSFPHDVSASIDASTMNGDIESDFPLTVRGKFGRRHVSGTVGRGEGGDLKLATVNGSIRLRSFEN